MIKRPHEFPEWMSIVGTVRLLVDAVNKLVSEKEQAMVNNAILPDALIPSNTIHNPSVRITTKPNPQTWDEAMEMLNAAQEFFAARTGEVKK